MPDLGSTEITMLWASTLLGLVYLLAAVVPSVLSRGMPWAMGPRDGEWPAVGTVAARLDRAWKNFLETFPLFAAAHAVAFVVRMMAGGMLPGWTLILAPMAEALLWPVITWLLLAPQRRAPDPDQNRPL